MPRAWGFVADRDTRELCCTVAVSIARWNVESYYTPRWPPSLSPMRTAPHRSMKWLLTACIAPDHPHVAAPHRFMERYPPGGHNGQAF